MKNTNQIHQLLQDAIEYKGDYAYDYIIKKCTEALALLPCETCNSTGEIKGPQQKNSKWVIICPLIPCPDCN